MKENRGKERRRGESELGFPPPPLSAFV